LTHGVRKPNIHSNFNMALAGSYNAAYVTNHGGTVGSPLLGAAMRQGRQA
jgi:hypothetical protein